MKLARSLLLSLLAGAALSACSTSGPTGTGNGSALLPTGQRGRHADGKGIQNAKSLYQYTTLDYPGAVSTVASGVNDFTQIVGFYVDSSGDSHAFILKNRRFHSITLSIPGVTVVQSVAYGIDNRGRIVGSYTDSTGERHGFELQKGGGVTTIDVPGANLARGDAAFGINQAGNIVGEFCNYFCYSVGVGEGYLLRNGTFTTLSYPGSDGDSGAASGINSHNEIVGTYEDLSGKEHGYSLVGSTYSSHDFPNDCGTEANGINSSRHIVGQYQDSSCAEHGFLLVGSKFTSLDVPGVKPGGGETQHFNGINVAGDIVGYYVDTSGITHGFAALPTLYDRRPSR